MTLSSKSREVSLDVVNLRRGRSLLLALPTFVEPTRETFGTESDRGRWQAEQGTLVRRIGAGEFPSPEAQRRSSLKRAYLHGSRKNGPVFGKRFYDFLTIL